MIILLFLSIFYYPIDFQSFILYSVGFLISLLGLLVIYITRNYIKTTIILVLFGFVLVFYSIFFLDVKSDVLEVEWLLVLLVFIFFKLGTIQGITLLVIEISLFTIYIFFFYRGDASIIDYSNLMLVGYIIEFIFPIFILVSYVHLSVKSNNISEKKLRSTNAVLKEQFLKIKEQNEEKTILLKEIHHRVKNNLQVIISLLRLQSSDLNQKDVNIHFDDAINRIMTLSLIHQKMYQKDNLTLIDTQDYFKTLIADLITSLSVNIPVQLKINSEIDYIGTKSFVPLALIISELVSNSLKHAFKNDGFIAIDFVKEGHLIHVRYFDNGNWKDEQENSSFGIQLVQTLCRQLGGTYKREILSKGTTYHLIELDVND
jgi:two-component sensor histidine kinase